MTPALKLLLEGMPKAELHIHIEGSLEPELIFSLAHRNGINLPYTSQQQLRAAYAFTDLQSFLDIYYAGASVLQTEDDFYDMAMAYFKRASADRVVHAELFFDPQTHTMRGVPMATVITGLHRACHDALQVYGLHAELILCFLRHLTQEQAIDTLKQALPWRHLFIGVGLDSSESGHPPEKFSAVFARCRELGLHVVAHAGEEGPPACIYTALDLLKAQRIDHGITAEQDPTLLQRLKQQHIPLTVCPLSNIKLCVFKNLESHNLKRLLEYGLCVTINSDDPAYFGGYINDNFIQTFQALDLGPQHAIELARNSFEASFVTAIQRDAWLLQLDTYYQGWCRQHG